METALWIGAALSAGWTGFVLGLDRATRKPIGAFLWGMAHPIGPPAPWWTLQRRAEWFEENGIPWE